MEVKVMVLSRSNDRLLSSISSVPSFFDNLFSREWNDWNNLNFSSVNSTLPACNIVEEKDHYLIEVAAPGLTRNDFKVSIVNNQLLISCEKSNMSEEKLSKYSRHEFSYETFQRAFSLPEGIVNGDNISARYTDGILYITLPKREEIRSKAPKEIMIM
jgi:HSP20 family protein